MNNSLASYKVFSSLIILLPIFRIIKIFPQLPSTLYYAMLFVLSIFVIINKDKKIYLPTFLFFYLCLLSILANNIPYYFHSFERYIGLILIGIVAGPIFYNNYLYRVRVQSLKYISKCFVCISVVSFLLYYIYRPLTITDRGNLFGGITVHSMILGPIAGLATISCIHHLHKNKLLINKRQIIFLIIACILCILSCILTGSRSSLIALGIALTIWLRLSFNLQKFIKYILLIISCFIITSPIWIQYTGTLRHKMDYSIEQGSILSSRSNKWEDRIEEFKESPILGYGFGSIKLSNDTTISDEWTGTVESGNGWLFVLSSCGLLSFLVLIYIYIKILLTLIKIKDQLSIFLTCSLVFIGVHTMAEGYIISSGNTLCFYFWLCLGTAICHIKLQNNIKL